MNIDYNRCKLVVKKINEHFYNKEDVAKIECPDTIKYNSNEYFVYMFYACLLNYGVRSKIYNKNINNTYLKYPYIFIPDYVVNMPEEELNKIIVNSIRFRYPNVATKKWIALSEELLKYDNMLEYLKRIKSFDELNTFIKGFKGYGQKTGGLLVRIICDSKICNFKEDVKSIPIDRHDIEISYMTNIIDSKNISGKDIAKLSDAYVAVCQELELSPSDIDRFLWETGNTYCNKKSCNECPINEICIKKI